MIQDNLHERKASYSKPENGLNLSQAFALCQALVRISLFNHFTNPRVVPIILIGELKKLETREV